MANRIDRRFRELNEKNKKAFIAYITAGDPSLAVTSKLVGILENSGVDILELGIPFSDPLADGPTIQAASQRALKAKTTLSRIFDMVGSLRTETDIPIVFMTYYNPVFRYGLEAFFEECKFKGVDGVIIPDLPYEETKDALKSARKHGIAVILLIAPTSTRKRVKDIAKSSSGFIYYVSLTGVTGTRKSLPEEVKSKVRQIKSVSNVPVCVGFGVSNARQAAAIANVADGVIVGSAIIKVIEGNLANKDRMLSKVSSFAKYLSKAIHSV